LLLNKIENDKENLTRLVREMAIEHAVKNNNLDEEV
jgi:hypothetical protein